MDQMAMEQNAEQHANAVVRGDMHAVASDLAPELRPSLPEVGKLLPQPTTSADVTRVEARGDHAIVEIRYSNADTVVTLRSRWEDIDGQALIVEAKPVD
jgi:hypothetical protein